MDLREEIFIGGGDFMEKAHGSLLMAHSLLLLLP